MKKNPMPKLRYRVLVEGDHVGMGGCGRAHWFETSPEAHEFASKPQCDIHTGQYGDPSNCWGDCKVTTYVYVEMEGSYLLLKETTRGRDVVPDGALF